VRKKRANKSHSSSEAFIDEQKEGKKKLGKKAEKLLFRGRRAA